MPAAGRSGSQALVPAAPAAPGLGIRTRSASCRRGFGPGTSGWPDASSLPTKHAVQLDTRLDTRKAKITTSLAGICPLVFARSQPALFAQVRGVVLAAAYSTDRVAVVELRVRDVAPGRSGVLAVRVALAVQVAIAPARSVDCFSFQDGRVAIRIFSCYGWLGRLLGAGTADPTPGYGSSICIVKLFH